MNDGMMSSNRGDWETPRALFERLNAEFEFGLDAAALSHNACCAEYLGPNHADPERRDGLVVEWATTDLASVWVNPPYGRSIGAWVQKASTEGLSRRVVALLPARTDTQWWHKYVMEAAEIRLLRGRVKFALGGRSVGPAPFPSCVVVWCPESRGLRLTSMRAAPGLDSGAGADLYRFKIVSRSAV